VASTRIGKIVNAPREDVYDTLLDPSAVARWKVPTGMTCEVHEFEAREGGSIRISLTALRGEMMNTSPADNEAGGERHGDPDGHDHQVAGEDDRQHGPGADARPRLRAAARSGIRGTVRSAG
jgi:hypothetical protein